jgi:hypothetical protein
MLRGFESLHSHVNKLVNAAIGMVTGIIIATPITWPEALSGDAGQDLSVWAFGGVLGLLVGWWVMPDD